MLLSLIVKCYLLKIAIYLQCNSKLLALNCYFLRIVELCHHHLLNIAQQCSFQTQHKKLDFYCFTVGVTVYCQLLHILCIMMCAILFYIMYCYIVVQISSLFELSSQIPVIKAVCLYSITCANMTHFAK